MIDSKYQDMQNAFIRHPTISALGQNPKWTISTKDKMPIDMFRLEYELQLSGCDKEIPHSAVTLSYLTNLLPDTANLTYYVESTIDNIVILDIEPKCPDELKDKLLKLPALYRETSMSKKGYHLIFRLPAHILNQYPAAKKKKVLKPKNGNYEFLLDHWITFTRNQIDSPDELLPIEEFYQLFEELCKLQTHTQYAQIQVDLEKPDFSKIPFSQEILAGLAKSAQDYNQKSPYEKAHDLSAYEFSYIGFLNYRLQNLLNVSCVVQRNFEYADTVQAWFLFEIAKDHIPFRLKHNSKRKQMPWLMYLATEVIAKSKARKEKQNEHT